MSMSFSAFRFDAVFVSLTFFVGVLVLLRAVVFFRFAFAMSALCLSLACFEVFGIVFAVLDFVKLFEGPWGVLCSTFGVLLGVDLAFTVEVRLKLREVDKLSGSGGLNGVIGLLRGRVAFLRRGRWSINAH